jgi:DNA-binding response OmpR family regulator
MAATKRVLVIDDEQLTLRLTTHIFQKGGYEVHLAGSGTEGLAKAESVKPDLVVLDVMMPDMNGLEVCQRLRANHSTASLPIIMLSAKGQIDDKVNGFRAGADDYVEKPVSPKELLARAYALLQRAQRGPAAKARIIAVVGAKGGVGVTTVAVNLATLLVTQDDQSVILAELRSHRGTVAHNLGMTPSQDLGNLLSKNPTQINQREVIRQVVPHTSGLRLMFAPQQVTDHALTATHAEVIIEGMSVEADYLILDLPVVAGPAVRQALERADQILLVTEPESLSLSCARADLETLKAWGVFDRMRLVVVSRSQSGTLIARKEIEEQLGVSVASSFPPAPEAFQLAASVGVPLVVSKPKTLAASSFKKLVKVLTERVSIAA